ncbi:hypothetical protein DERF_011051 [Dermatophagoides farinae]|uniref:Uncharacterized protein n=1 Tax=Dermatophagoides farinae TaxID=6954 RepID=A0A922HS87_DERFA|nr:hypothetical protein DERF_011051 [Dermatophagoides farinae]
MQYIWDQIDTTTNSTTCNVQRVSFDSIKLNPQSISSCIAKGKSERIFFTYTNRERNDNKLPNENDDDC